VSYCGSDCAYTAPAGWVDASEEAEEQPGQDGADQPASVIASITAGTANAPSPRPQTNGSDSAAKIDVLRYGHAASLLSRPSVMLAAVSADAMRLLLGLL